MCIRDSTKNMSITVLEQLRETDPELYQSIFAKPIEEVEDSRKMLKLRINLGENTRTVFAGIKKSYSPDDLLDKQVIVIANLMPREMKFGVSDGMVLATSDKEEIVLISPLKNVTPGSKIS